MELVSLDWWWWIASSFVGIHLRSIPGEAVDAVVDGNASHGLFGFCAS